MQPARLPVRTAMIAVAVVAIELAAIRAVFSKALTFGLGLHALINAVPIGLALNLGLLQLCRTRGRARAFWAGFLLCGAAAMMTSAWAALTPAGSVRSATGGPNEALHGSMAWSLWNAYFVFAVGCLEALRLDVRSLTRHRSTGRGRGTC